MKPNFIGIGVQKCATAWLFNILNEHPQIVMAKTEAGEKDLQFFGYFYDRGFEWYEKHFLTEGNQISGEYSTSYFYNREAPKRIFNYSPNIKLIVSLRHPVERAFSNHKHEIKHQRVSGDNILFENGVLNNPLYLYQSLYYTHLSRWLKYFKKDQILVVLIEDIQKNPAKFVENIYTFLGVNPAYNPSMLKRKVHETTMPKSTTLELYKTKTSKILKNSGLGFYITILKIIGIKNIIDHMNTKNKTQSFPPMLNETRCDLLEYFKQENKSLGELLQLDLSNWNK